MLDALRGLLPAIVRHVLAYSELLHDETGEALRDLRRRLLGLALALAAAWMALLFGGVWIIAATWDGPNRLLAVGALCLGFLVIAVVCALVAARGRPTGRPRPFERLRAEWRADMEELMALNPSLAEARGFNPDLGASPSPKPQAAHVP